MVGFGGEVVRVLVVNCVVNFFLEYLMALDAGSGVGVFYSGLVDWWNCSCLRIEVSDCYRILERGPGGDGCFQYACIS